MYLPILFFVTLLSSVLAATNTPLSAEIFYWPLSSSKPSRLAQISYDASLLQSTVISYTPPSPDSNAAAAASPNGLVRVGLYTSTDSDPKHWVGSLTSLSSLQNNTQSQTLSLYLDSANNIYHASISPVVDSQTSSKSSTSQKGGMTVPELLVELVKTTPGPNPHLNRPIALGPDGKGPEEVVEKTFFQKYWWVLLGIGFMAMTGSAER